jgi:hypothetical protein
MDGNYALTSDIDCSMSSTWNGGAGFIPIGTAGNRFEGTFDGANHTISDLYINRNASDEQGLFSFLQNASVMNLTFDNASVTADDQSGILAGDIDETDLDNITIQNSTFTGDMENALLCGLIDDTTIDNITLTNSTITTNLKAGGLAGVATQSQFFNINLSQITLNVSQSAGGLIGEMEETTLDEATIDQINIVSFNNTAQSIGAAIGRAQIDSILANVNISNLNMNTTNSTSSTSVGGVIGRVHTGTSVNSCSIKNSNIVAHDKAGGFAGSITNINPHPNQTKVTNCYVEDLIVTGESVAGFIHETKNNIIVDGCHVKNLDLDSSDASGGFVAVMNGEGCLIEDSYITEADLDLHSNKSGGFGGSLEPGSNVDRCFAKNITINTDALDRVAGFVSVISLSNVNESFVEDLIITTNTSGIVSGFSNKVGNNSNLTNCYVFNAAITSTKPNGNVNCFAHEIESNSIVSNSFCSAELQGDDDDQFADDVDPNVTLTNIYFNADKNPGASNDSAATGIAAANFFDVANFTGFDINIWSSGDEHPELDSLQAVISNLLKNITDENNILTLEYNEIYPFLRKDTVISNVNLLTTENNNDFTFTLENADDDIYIVGRTLYSKRIFNKDEKFSIIVKATNTLNEFVAGEFIIKVLNRPFRPDLGDLKPDEPDDIDECLLAAKKILNLADTEQVTFDKLIDVVLKIKDLKMISNSSELQKVLSCDSLAADIKKIEKDLQVLKLNSNGRLNFKSYSKFIKKFKRLASKQSDYSCERLIYDSNADCRLTKLDLEYYKRFFEISINQRHSERKVNKKLDNIESSRRLNRFFAIKLL